MPHGMDTGPRNSIPSVHASLQSYGKLSRGLGYIYPKLCLLAAIQDPRFLLGPKQVRQACYEMHFGLEWIYTPLFSLPARELHA